jgi:hypothetical protein
MVYAAALAWVGCSNQAVGPTDNPEIDNQASEDDDAVAGAPPTVAVEPGDTADIALVPASRETNKRIKNRELGIKFANSATALQRECRISLFEKAIFPRIKI